MDTYLQEKKAVIKELKRLVESYSRSGEPPPRALGGPYNLTPQQMIQEVENDTAIGRDIVKAFTSLKREFPTSP